MNESGLATIEQIREFLGGTANVGFSVPSEPAQRLLAFSPGAPDAQHQHSGSVRLGSKARRTSYACKFTIADIAAMILAGSSGHGPFWRIA